MPHLLRLEEFEINHRYYCNDNSEFPHKGSISSYWWAVPRMLDMPLDKFVKMLIDDFHVDYITYYEDKDVLTYSWKSQATMRKYKNWVNAQARKKNFVC